MKKRFLLLFVMLILLAAGCEITPPGEYTPTQQNGTMDQVSDLFVPQENGSVLFETNDTRYWSSYGYTLWNLTDQEPADLVSRTSRTSRLSGNSRAGFGFIYCYREDPVAGSLMLIVLINTEREYLVGEITGTTFREILPWTESTLLNRGYNVGNEIELAYANSEYTLNINGVRETTFRDEEPPYHTRGQMGYMVIISPLDQFPEVPVKISFKESQE